MDESKREDLIDAIDDLVSVLETLRHELETGNLDAFDENRLKEFENSQPTNFGAGNSDERDQSESILRDCGDTDSSIRSRTTEDMVRFTDDSVIPAMITVFEANIRALEGLHRLLSLQRTDRRVHDNTLDDAHARTDRAIDHVSTILSTLDSMRVDLQEAISGELSATDSSTRDLVAEGNPRYSEIDQQNRESFSDDAETSDSAESYRIDVQDGYPDDPTESAAGESPASPVVDVEAELETLKDEFGSTALRESATDVSNERSPTDGDSTDDSSTESDDDGDAP